MLSLPIVSTAMSLELPDKAGAAANVLLAAGAVLLKPAFGSLLISISGFPDSSVTTFGGCIGDVTYSKGLTLEPAIKGYQHHDIVAPFLKTTKPILSSMPLLQPSSTTAASGVMFGMTACFLSLVAAGAFLVRSHAGSETGEPGGRSPSSLSDILAYNREQRQAQNGRTAARRRSRRGPPNPMPPNNNQNNNTTGDIKPPAQKRFQVGEGIQVGAPPPPPPPPPPQAGVVAVHPDDVGRKAVMNILWKFLFGLSFIVLFVKSISTSNCSYPKVDDVLVDWDSDNMSPSMPTNFREPMELRHFSADVPSRLRSLLARFQVIYKTICGFVPPVFVSPYFFLELAIDYLLCTLFCRILSSICTLASGSACTEIQVKEEDYIIPVEVSLSEQYIPQLPCKDIPTQLNQLENLGNSEQVPDTPSTAVTTIVAEDVMVDPLPSEPGPLLVDVDPPTQIVERRSEDIPPQVDQLEVLGNLEQVSVTPGTAVMTVDAEDIMAVPLPSPSEPGPSLAEADPPIVKKVIPPGRTRRTRPRRHPNRPPRTETIVPMAS